MKNTLLGRYVAGMFFTCVLAACGGGANDTPTVNPTPTPVLVPAPIPALPVALPLAEMRILVIGQSIASNCNDYAYGLVDGVFQIDKSGNTKPASDPFEWADCIKGSVWMPLGKRLIDAGIAEKVTFMPIGVGGSKVEDWQVGGSAFSKLNTALVLAQKKGITFDLALWHQGSANAGDSQAIYRDKLNSVLNYVSAHAVVNRWLIAIHSRCSGVYDRNVEAAQIEIGSMSALERYPGANNNALGDEFRVDRCHLNRAGQEKLSSLWLESIEAALK